MSLSGLGSIFSKLCDSFSCVFGTLCNCSHNQVLVVGDPNNPAAKELMDISAAHQDLTEALKTLSDKEALNTRSVTIKSVSASQQKENQLLKERAALLHAAHTSLQKLSHREMRDEERIIRLTAAAALAGIENLNRSTSISDRDLKAIKQQVSFVQNYGSSAAFLWEQLKKENCADTENLKKLLNKKILVSGQVPILSKLFKMEREASFLNKDRFSDLDIKIQAVFLQAAQIFPKKHEALQRFTSWIESSRESSPARASSESFYNREELRLLISDLSLAKTRRDEPEKDCPVGIKRAELLCSLNGIGEMGLERLTQDQILLLRKNIHRLQQLDGTIVHLFVSLKNSLDPVELKKHYFFTEEITQTIKKEMKKNGQIQIEMQLAENLSELTIDSLKFLYEVADKFPLPLISKFSSQYRLSSWLSNAVIKTSSLHLPASSSKEAHLRQEVEAAERIMDEERERAAQNIQSRNSPERKVPE